MLIMVQLVSLLANFKFMSVSLRRPVARCINSSMAYSGDVVLSSDAKEGGLGPTIAGPNGVCVQAGLNGENLIDLCN